MLAVSESMLEASDPGTRAARNQTLAVLAAALLMRLLVLWIVA